MTPFLGTEALSAGTVTRRSLEQHRRLHRNVFLPPGSPVTATVRAQAAWLWSDRRAVVGGLSASALFGTRWIDAGTHRLRSGPTHGPAERRHPGRRAWYSSRPVYRSPAPRYGCTATASTRATRNSRSGWSMTASNTGTTPASTRAISIDWRIWPHRDGGSFASAPRSCAVDPRLSSREPVRPCTQRAPTGLGAPPACGGSSHRFRAIPCDRWPLEPSGRSAVRR